MLHTKETFTDIIAKSPLFDTYFGHLKVGFMDIETTGLSPDRCKFILGGLVIIQKTEPVAEDLEKLKATLLCCQYFSEYNTVEDEKAALSAYMTALKELDVIISYNGARFDVPFLKTRCRKHGINFKEGFPFNLDLYQVVNKYSDLRKFLPNLRQKTLETYCGLSPTRTDAISGSESVDLYFAYLAHKAGQGKENLMKTIILHNSDDCRQLCRLLPVIKKTDFHKAISGLGFPAGSFHVSGIYYKARKLLVQGFQQGIHVNYCSYSDITYPCTIKLDSLTGTVELQLDITELPAKNEAPALSLIDTRPYDIDVSLLKNLPGFENDYIIVKKGGGYNHLTVNSFVRLLLENLSRRFQ